MTSSTSSDQQRIYRLYHYLFTCLAMKQRADGAPNYSGISERLGGRDLRKTVSSLLQEGIGSHTSTKVSNVTTGSVVKMLSTLRRKLRADYQQHEEPYTRVVTPEDMLVVLYKLIDLTPDERHELDLPANDGLTLLQRTLLALQTANALENYEMLFQVYKMAVGIEFAGPTDTLQSLAQVDALIEETVATALSYLPYRQSRGRNGERPSPGRDETVRELTLKAQREIRRLLARSGNQQSRLTDNASVNSYIRHYLRPTFVTKLAQSVVTNERLTDEFPVYLKRLTFEPCGPLPFAAKDLGVLQEVDGPYPALLHPALRRLDQVMDTGQSTGLPDAGDYELASQEATKVTLEFYVKVPEGYAVQSPRVFAHLASENARRIDFALSSTGIGGALSHVIKVVNIALLRDIPCLRDYFSIAHDVTSTQEIIRDNVPSPVWAHSLVKLCHIETVGQTVQACQRDRLCSYEDYAFADPIGHGDYCGFDFMLSQAQASLHARLQAIRHAGVFPQRYLKELCQRTEQLIALQDALSYLREYPFSTLAMIGVIEREVLYPLVERRSLQKTDPYICFEACLSIIEALLDEGAYRSARRYLQRLEVLEDFVNQGLAIAQQDANSRDSFEVFSGAIVVRYLLCLANYCYVYDTNDRDARYLPPRCEPDINREGLVRRAWISLDQAQQHVGVRLQKYVLINEVSQGTFDPHYWLLARIAVLRAKLLLFFPGYVPKDERYLPTDRFSGQRRPEAMTHWGRLYLLEKARLYAAANGNSELYACYAAMQAWAYLMVAYTTEDRRTLPPSTSARSGRGEILAPQDCLKWARQLRDHALTSYAETGRRCYYQIKEKSGLHQNNVDTYGQFRVHSIPAIYEMKGQEHEQGRMADTNLLVLDMSLLGVKPHLLPKLAPDHPTQNIYLFGTNACYLFFVRGMYLLCSEGVDEFQDTEPPRDATQLDTKLTQATRLLNLAWAIAEEGGDIERRKQDNVSIFTITRPLESHVRNGEYTSREVDSVRDLYPRRVTEIADLGKIFSAACMTLRLHTAPADERESLATDINRLLSSLHSAHYFQNRTLRALLAKQKRYNGYLQTYLDRATAAIQRHVAIAQATPQPGTISEYRHAVLEDLFTALLN